MRYCKICSLKSTHPGVVIAGDGVCNLCKLDVAGEMLAAYRYTSATYDEFLKAPPHPEAEFDCMLMYSGGKDSTFMLDKFVNTYRKRVLAYTFDVPFESVHAARNIDLAREKIAATFMLDRADDDIRRVMRAVFNRPQPDAPGKYLDEKLPCVSCRTFFVIRAIIKAYQEKIPYILICADPQQILTMESNVRQVVRSFCSVFGVSFATDLLGEVVEEILFAEQERLPKIVFPFIDLRHSYDPDTIVADLKAKGLYQSSPMETHCTLFPLLNYYSFRHFDCMFYKLNAASHQRAVRRNGAGARATFSIKFPDSLRLAEVEDRMKDAILALAAGEGDPAAHQKTLEGVFNDLGVDGEGARFVAGNFLNMRSLAQDLGVVLE
ncbi:MAG: OzmP [Telmatospirillum sp.]|nr:OzmP [Telmatospirillum sp.]